MIPKRIWAILDTDQKPSWFFTIDEGHTFERVDGDRARVGRDRLTLLGHGLNDMDITKQFPRSQRAAFQKPRYE